MLRLVTDADYEAAACAIRVRARSEQGLPDQIEDSHILDTLALLLDPAGLVPEPEARAS